MKFIKMSTNVIYEYRIINGKAYLSPISNNKRIQALGINELLVWIGKDLDNGVYSSVFDLVKKPKFRKDENHLVVEPVCDEEIIFADVEEMFDDPCENGMFRLNSDCISPQTTDLLIPLHYQGKIDKSKVNEEEILLYLRKISSKVPSNLLQLDYQIPSKFLAFIKKEYPSIYPEVSTMNFSNYQKEIYLLLGEAFSIQGDVTDAEYDFLEDVLSNVDEEDKLSMMVDREVKNNVLEFKRKETES